MWSPAGGVPAGGGGQGGGGEGTWRLEVAAWRCYPGVEPGRRRLHSSVGAVRVNMAEPWQFLGGGVEGGHPSMQPSHHPQKGKRRQD